MVVVAGLVYPAITFGWPRTGSERTDATSRTLIFLSKNGERNE